MEDVRLNVRALAAMMKQSITDLATSCGINPNHLRQVSAGNVKMTADDLKRLSDYCKVPADNIVTD